MQQQLFFDLDDTLIHCNKYFYLVIEQFIDIMSEWFAAYPEITPEAIRTKQTEIDIAGVAVLGFKSEHFPQSFVDTYTHFSHLYGRKQSPKETDMLWKLGLSVYALSNEPYPNMERTLGKLAQAGHVLHLYTGGEAAIQQRKIERLELERFFGNRIYIRQHKNNEALELILSNGDFDRANTWMIGNSIRTDVIPALTAGIHAIHVRAANEWEYNVMNIDIEPQGAFFQLDQLRQVPTAIHSYVYKKL